MRLNYWLIVTAIVITLFLGFPGIARMRAIDIPNAYDNSSVEIQVAQSNSPTKNKSEVLYFGFPDDSSPYNPINSNSKIQSYCANLIHYLQEEKRLNFRLISLKVDERFLGVADGHKLVGECSNNSITEERKNKLRKVGGKFSDPFFETGTKLLLKNEYLQEFFTQKIPLKGKKIAVVKTTTTQELIQKVFSSFSLSDILAFSNRWDATEALKKDDEIAAYASDEVILKGLWENDAVLKNSYSIVPRFRPLSYNESGIVVYNNKELLQSINAWINSKEGKAAKADLENLVKPNWLDQGLIYLISFYERSLSSFQIFFVLISIIFLLIFISLLFLFLLIKLAPLSITEIIVEKVQNINNKKINLSKATAKAEIQQILDQLSQNHPISTPEEQRAVANEAIKKIERNPKLRERILSALRVGGTSALEQFLNHPLASFMIEALKDWQENNRD